jgi:5-amino-6-(5-phosphoribosylamino)uracil reductase
MRSILVLATSVDGKITNAQRDPAKFGSREDFRRMELQVAAADGVLIGAGTLRTHGTTMRVISEGLMADRQSRGLPPQPIQIVCSRSGNLPKDLKFFQQPVIRWLLTTTVGSEGWVEGEEFQKILVHSAEAVDWRLAWQQLALAGIDRLCVLGGAEIATALWQIDLIDELRLTICPLIIGGAAAPTLCDGSGLAPGKSLELVGCEAIDGELFVHYHSPIMIPKL